MNNIDIQNRRKEIEEIIKNAKAELSELNHSSFARTVSEEMLTSIRNEGAVSWNCSTEWSYLRLLAVSLHRKKKDFGFTENKYKRINEMSAEDFKISLDFLNEVIPIWNRYFLTANKDLIDEIKEQSEDRTSL